MRRAYFKTLFFLYALAIVLCVGSRSVLYLRFTDSATGLYTGGEPLVLLFQGALLFFIVSWFLMTTLRRSKHDYPLGTRGQAARVLSALCGLAMLLCALLNAVEILDRYSYGMVPRDPFSSYLYKDPTVWTFALLGVKLLTGALGALSMILFAFLREPGRASVLGVFPTVWQLVVLLERFTGLLSPTQISDNLLFILFMTMSSLFLLGQARSLCGMSISNSRNYLIPAGLSASLTGFCMAVPKLFFSAQGETYAFLSGWQLGLQIYALLLSVYAAVFLYGYVRAIRVV